MSRTLGTASKKVLAGGFTAALLGAAVLSAPLAAADDIPVDGQGGIDLTLSVVEVGELIMSVETGTPVALAEQDSADENRVFTGTLPTVTVSDTRGTVPGALAWSVVGQAAPFTHVDDPAVQISNEFLGWTPSLIDPVEQPDLEAVAAGDEVLSAAEDDESAGLSGGFDLLIGSYTSEEAQELSEEWNVTAELKLVAPADDIVVGNYTSTLTLSLFEY